MSRVFKSIALLATIAFLFSACGDDKRFADKKKNDGKGKATTTDAKCGEGDNKEKPFTILKDKKKLKCVKECDSDDYTIDKDKKTCVARKKKNESGAKNDGETASLVENKCAKEVLNKYLEDGKCVATCSAGYEKEEKSEKNKICKMKEKKEPTAEENAKAEKEALDKTIKSKLEKLEKMAKTDVEMKGLDLDVVSKSAEEILVNSFPVGRLGDYKESVVLKVLMIVEGKDILVQADPLQVGAITASQENITVIDADKDKQKDMFEAKLKLNIACLGVGSNKLCSKVGLVIANADIASELIILEMDNSQQMTSATAKKSNKKVGSVEEALSEPAAP